MEIRTAFEQRRLPSVLDYWGLSKKARITWRARPACFFARRAQTISRSPPCFCLGAVHSPAVRRTGVVIPGRRPGRDPAKRKVDEKAFPRPSKLMCRSGNKRPAAAISLVTETLLSGVVRSARSTQFKENVNANHVSPGSLGICSCDCGLWAERQDCLR